MPPKFTSRQLAYEAPPVPSFLQKLHNQVNQNRGHIDDKRGGRNEVTSEFDDLLGVASSSSKKNGNAEAQQVDAAADSDAEEEWDGAQVVVLKEGKHLSKEEAGLSSDGSRAATNLAKAEEPQERVIVGAESTPRHLLSKRRTIETSSTQDKKGKQEKSMEEAKSLIASSKIADNPDQDEGQGKRKVQEEKKKRKEERNKRARVEKSKMGKGLSFSLED